jgi:hypothetical protein
MTIEMLSDDTKYKKNQKKTHQSQRHIGLRIPHEDTYQ